MRLEWISDLVPDARGVRWAFGLLLLPAVWLARTPGAPSGTPANTSHPVAAEGRAPQALRTLPEPRLLVPHATITR